MVFEIPEISEIPMILKELKEIKSKLDPNLPEWLNDEQCWKLKGGLSLSTYRSNRFYQCKGGIPDSYVGGRKVWNKDSVLEWLSITDDKLEFYHKKYCTGATKKAGEK